MAFIIRDFDKLSLSVTTNAPLPYTFGSTTDNLVTILTSSYFNEVKGVLVVSDVIVIQASDKLTYVRVSAVTPNVVVNEIFLKANIVSSTSTSILTSGQGFIGVDTTGGPVTITLSSADLAVEGFDITIKDIAAKVTPVNNIIINTEGSETIDTVASITISISTGAVNIFSFGGNGQTY